MSNDRTALEREVHRGFSIAPASPEPERRHVFADDLEAALTGLCGSAREVLDAAYAALGVLDARRAQLEHFVTAGIDGPTRERIGVHPRGRGVLGLLVADPRVMHIEDVAGDPRGYGFPDGHPEMHDFLGAPILIDGTAWGNLYVAGKRHGAFDEVDEHVIAAIAARAATVVQDSRSGPGSGG